ncbi:MAG TPA: pilus assembly protein TadG-related protein [Ramlibacter sp.]|nr:pilus assembly protein TadG-related protein [Ramlibacter sp.]
MIVTLSMVMLLLLGFIGAALDFGRLFVIKTELQTAMDSCALAAAQELDNQPTAISRAIAAGRTAGTGNRVDFQSANWSGLGQLVDAEVTFRDTAYVTTTNPALAKYAQCQHTHTGRSTWILQALGAFSGTPALAANTRNVAASAVATRGSTQTTCPIPVAVRPKPGGVAPNFGYTPGEWITMLVVSDNGQGGYIGWANLDGSSSASETTREMNGFCGVRVGDTLGTPGVQSSIADNWNWRFGIYKNSEAPGDLYHQPDFTGYSYTATNWPSRFNAYNGPTPAGAPASAANFVTKRGQFANCANTTTQQSVNACENIINRTLNSFQKLAPGGAAAVNGHRQYGVNRRVVVAPVTNGYPGSVADYLCLLMLQPLSIPKADIQLEFIGNASAPGSPCTTSGLPGGAAGPLVPVLVR